MKKYLLILLFVFILFACMPHHEDIITVDDDGYLIVNGTKTEYYVQEPENLDLIISINEDGYWIINNEVTTYHRDDELVMGITDDNYLKIFDIQTNIKVKLKEKVVNPNYQNYGGLFPNVTSEMLVSQFWINLYENCDEVIMDEKEIKSFNEKILENSNTNTIDLLKVPATITKAELENKVNQYKLYSEYYLDNILIDETEKTKIYEKLNLSSITDTVNIRYGIITNNTSMRSFPTNQKLTKTIDGDFDYFQETGLKIGDGIIIYHQTSDQSWSFVRCEYYEGWVKTCDIGFCSQEEFTNYLKQDNFIIITANKFHLDNSSFQNEIKDITLYMGTKLPLVENPPMTIDNRTTIGSYVVKLPRRSEDGKLKLVDVLIPVTADVNNGYLDYTLRNLFQQAMKLHGTAYGWGDMDFNRDCSSTVVAIYKCFGFIMPRNTSNQNYLPGKSLSLSNILPGSLIFTPGHVMLYLGEVNNKHYCLHNFSKYRLSPTSEIYQAMSCQITTLDLYRQTGTTYRYSITKIIAIY